MPEFTYIAPPMPFVSPWVTTTTYTALPVYLPSAVTQTPFVPRMSYATYAMRSVPGGTIIGYIDTETSTFDPAGEAGTSRTNVLQGIAGMFMDLGEAVADLFHLNDDGWGEELEYEKFLSPSGLVIAPSGRESLAVYASAAISSEPVVPNNRMILDLQSVPYEGDITGSLADLARLADETGVIICVKLPHPPYVHEFVPAVLRAHSLPGIAWALGAQNYQIHDRQVIKLIREVFTISRPHTYGDLFQRFIAAGLSNPQLTAAQEIIREANGGPIVGQRLAALEQVVIELLQRTPKSVTTRQFRGLFDELPEDVQIKARETYQMWRLNPMNPIFRFKPMTGFRNYWSIDVAGTSWKAAAVKTPSGVYRWIYIGPHEGYNNFLKLMRRRPSENGHR